MIWNENRSKEENDEYEMGCLLELVHMIFANMRTILIGRLSCIVNFVLLGRSVIIIVRNRM